MVLFAGLLLFSGFGIIIILDLVTDVRRKISKRLFLSSVVIACGMIVSGVVMLYMHL